MITQTDYIEANPVLEAQFGTYRRTVEQVHTFRKRDRDDVILAVRELLEDHDAVELGAAGGRQFAVVEKWGDLTAPEEQECLSAIQPNGQVECFDAHMVDSLIGLKNVD